MSVTSKRHAWAVAALAACSSVGILALWGAPVAGQGSGRQAAPLMGPSGRYNPSDIKNAQQSAQQPFSQAMRARVMRALKGSVDIHNHTHPDTDVDERPLDAIDFVKRARTYGLRAIVLKNHYETTAAQAYLMRREFPGIEIFGGVDLNLPMGGMNVAAVEQMARLKGGWGRLVWMSTNDSEASVRRAKENRPFVSVARNGELLPETKAVIASIAKHNLVLATGHVSPEEGLLLIAEGRRQGVQHIVVTHAIDVQWTVPQMQQGAKMGAFIEFAKGRLTEEVVEAIRKVGPEYCIVSQTGVSFLPEELIGSFVAGLIEHGFTDHELDRMMKVNSARLLGLSDKS